jgi:hypothetical protein
LEHELARRRRGVDRLLIELQVDAAGPKVLDCAQSELENRLKLVRHARLERIQSVFTS